MIQRLTQSAFSLSWAMSLFGAEQFATLLTLSPSSLQKIGGEIDAVTQAAVTELGAQSVMQGIFQAGDEIQREAVDWLFRFVSPEALTAGNVMPWPTEAARCLISPRDALFTGQELRNKIEVFILVPGIPSRLQLPSEPPYPPLLEAVARAYAMEPYPALWAVEGLGDWYGDMFWKRNETPHQILSPARAGALPDKSLLMLHAGVGLSIAKHFLRTVNHTSPHADIRRVVEQIVTLCRDNSRPGYAGAALESMGLVTRSATFTADARPDIMVQIVSRILAESAPDVLGYFWHGVGRGTYFLPINFLPCYGSIWHAVQMIQQEVPDDFAWRNAIAGLIWGVTMVNIRQPAIVAYLLQQHGSQLTANDAFSYGVASSLMMRYDTTPDAPFIAPFYQYQPESADVELDQLWRSQVTLPATAALQEVYPVLKQEARLGDIFHYQRFPALSHELRQDAA